MLEGNVTVGSSEQPDLGALYLRYKDVLHRVAASVLRDRGLADQAEDAVQEAFESIMKSPPNNVGNWEAFLVTAVKHKALDRISSAAVRHDGGGLTEPDEAALTREPDHADDVMDAIDRARAASRVWDALAVLDARDRQIVWEYVAKARPRQEVARQFGVTPARISQIATSSLARLRTEMEKEVK
jgi:RNA polymerase sigma factor (sigma-70 family)